MPPPAIVGPYSMGAYQPLPALGPFGPYPNAAGTALYSIQNVVWRSTLSVSPGELGAFKSIDNGATWVEQDAAGRPVLSFLADASPGSPAWTVNGGIVVKHPTLEEIWVAYYGPGVNNTTYNVSVAIFDMSTDSWTVVSTTGPAVDLLTPYTDPLFPFGTKYYSPPGLGTLSAAFESTTGSLVISYSVVDPFITFTGAATPHGSQRAWRTAFNGAAWAAAAEIVPQPTNTDLVMIFTGCSGFAPGAGGRVHAVVQYADQTRPNTATAWSDPSVVLTTAYYHWLAADGAGAFSAIFTNIVTVPATDSGYVSTSAFEPVSGTVIIQGGFTEVGTGTTLFLTLYAVSTDSPVWSQATTPDDGFGNNLDLCLVTEGALIRAYALSQVNTCFYRASWTGSGFTVPSQWATGFVVANPAYLVGTYAGAALGPGFTYADLDLVLPDGEVPMYVLFADTAGVDIEIIGGAVFGGSSVIPNGVVMGGGGTGGSGVGGSGLIPGGAMQPPGMFDHMKGWPVWPPIFRQANYWDKCLQAFKCHLQKYPMQDASRCVDMLELWSGNMVPRNCKEFWESFRIVTPVPGETLVGQFRVPTGFAGMLYGIHLGYTGTGFEESSGDIIWRVMIGNAWAAKGLGNVTVQLGTPGQCLQLTDYIKLKSNQLVQVWVNVPNTSGNIQVGLSRILATLQGWYYPQ